VAADEGHERERADAQEEESSEGLERTTGGLRQHVRKLLILLVRLGGLEPPTKGLGNPCSFHLSYSRPGQYNKGSAKAVPAQYWISDATS